MTSGAGISDVAGSHSSSESKGGSPSTSLIGHPSDSDESNSGKVQGFENLDEMELYKIPPQKEKDEWVKKMRKVFNDQKHSAFRDF